MKKSTQTITTVTTVVNADINETPAVKKTLADLVVDAVADVAAIAVDGVAKTGDVVAHLPGAKGPSIRAALSKLAGPNGRIARSADGEGWVPVSQPQTTPEARPSAPVVVAVAEAPKQLQAAPDVDVRTAKAIVDAGLDFDGDAKRALAATTSTPPAKIVVAGKEATLVVNPLTTATKVTANHGWALKNAYEMAKRDSGDVKDPIQREAVCLKAVVVALERFPVDIRGAAVRLALAKVDVTSGCGVAIKQALTLVDTKAPGTPRAGAVGGGGKTLATVRSSVITRRNTSNPNSDRFIYIGIPRPLAEVGTEWDLTACTKVAEIEAAYAAALAAVAAGRPVILCVRQVQAAPTVTV